MTSRVVNLALLGLVLGCVAWLAVDLNRHGVTLVHGAEAHAPTDELKLRRGEWVRLAIEGDANRTYAVDIAGNGGQVLAKNLRQLRGDCLGLGQFCTYKVQATPEDTLTIHWALAGTLQGVDVRVLRESHGGEAALAPWSRIFLLLGLLLPVIWLTHRWRALSQWILVGAALAFLAMVDWRYALVLAGFLVANHWFCTRFLSVRGRYRLVVSSVLVALLFLVSFKYFYPQLGEIFADPGGFGLLLPLGISYFVIRLIDVQLKWYRGDLRETGLREYLSFILFPATIPAGPIHTLPKFHEDRLERISVRDVGEGAGRIAIGVFKKLVLADFFIAEALYGAEGLYDQAVLTPFTAAEPVLLGFLCLALLYVYLDFSAYSDIAIGLSRVLGYRMVENFNWPILARNMRDFWTRWHMSLSGWCMRNIYMPVMIQTKNFTYPTYAVMVTIGLWHSLTLSWLFWGLHHASGINLVRWFQEKRKGRRLGGVAGHAGRAVGVALTFLFASAAHAFTQVHDIGTAVIVYVRFWLSLVTWPLKGLGLIG